MMIEYRKLKRDGRCGICYKAILRNKEKVSVVQFVTSKNPKINICRDCAYKIFYAPVLGEEDGVFVEEDNPCQIKGRKNKNDIS